MKRDGLIQPLILIGIIVGIIGVVVACGTDYFESQTIVLLATGVFIAWQAWETRRLAELTRVKEQPLLEIEFELQKNGAKVLLKNIGQSPAYSPSISSVEIAENEHLDFDPLHASRLPILPGESREVWMHHQRVSNGSISGYLESAPVLEKAIASSKSPIKITLQYFDKNGEKLSRNLYIKIGGNKISGNQQIYTSTSPEG